MLEIKNLHVQVEDNAILKGIDLAIRPGEVHAIMGPNGSGKSTLSSTLAGKEDYETTSGEITFNHKNLLELDPAERAGEGVFLAFQYPVEIPGVSNKLFCKRRSTQSVNTASYLSLIVLNLKIWWRKKSAG